MSARTTLIYLDDSIDSGSHRVEVITLNYLKTALQDEGVAVLGFSTLENALAYFEDPAHGCNLFVCDHNLWWGRESDGSYRYRFGCDFMSRLHETRPDLKEVGIIIYTDSPDYAYREWSQSAVAFAGIVPKYSEDNMKHPWEAMLDEIRHVLDREGEEGHTTQNL